MPSNAKLVQSLINRIAIRLPTNNKNRRTNDGIEQDPSIQQTVSTIIEISVHKFPLVLDSLCQLLENESVCTKTLEPECLSPHVLNAQIFILRLIMECLEQQWIVRQNNPPASQSVDSGIGSENVSSSGLSSTANEMIDFVYPATLDDALALRTYNVAMRFMHLVHAVEQEQLPVYPSDSRLDDGHNRLDAKTLDLVMEMNKLATQFLYYISASTWPFFYKKLRAMLQGLTTLSSSDICPSEVRIMAGLCINCERLGECMPDFTSHFPQMRRQAKIMFARMLRTAIWTWIKTHCQDLTRMYENKVRSPAGIDKLFEMCYAAADNSTKKYALYPLQTTLLIISPELLSQTFMESKSAQNRKANFIDVLKSSLSSQRTVDIAAICFVDFCRACTLIPPNEGASIRSIVSEVEDDLKARVISVVRAEPRSVESAISQQLLATDYLLASLRTKTDATLKELEHFYLRDDSPIAFKRGIVKSCLTIVQDYQPHPWNPSLAVMYTRLSPQLRSLFLRMVATELRQAPPRGDSATVLTSPKRTASMTAASGTIMGRSHETTMLLYDLLLLFKLDPFLALLGDGADRVDQNGEIMKALVELLQHNDSSIRFSAVECLGKLHSADHIQHWGPRAQSMQNFWLVSSKVVFHAARQILSKRSNDDNLRLLFTTLIQILLSRSKYLQKYQEYANEGAESKDRLQASVALEIALLISLCSPNTDICSDTLRCIDFLCIETALADTDADAYQSMITLKSNLNTYKSMANEGSVFLGRKLQQKSVRKYLRMMTRQTPGALAAWEEAWKRWKTLTQEVSHFGEEITEYISANDSTTGFKKGGKFEKGRMPDMKPVVIGRVEVDEDKRVEWLNYNGFLAALGACCLDADDASSISGQTAKVSKSSEQAAMVDKFVKDMIDMLTADNVFIREGARDALGNDLSPALYPNLVKHLEAAVSNSFDSSGEAVCTESSTLLVEEAVLVLKPILDRLMEPSDYLLSIDVSLLIKQFAAYLGKLPNGYAALRIKIKMCQLVETLMQKKDQVIVRDGMRLRNKLLEIIVEWTSDFALQATNVKHGSQPNSGSRPANEKLHRDLDQACLKTIVALLDHLPLQPLELVRDTDTAQVKSRLFYKYFSFFLKLLDRCRLHEIQSTMRSNAMSKDTVYISNRPMTSTEDGQEFATLKHYTILAMSNLLRSNVDTGLKYSLAMGYHDDPRTRAAFMQVLTNILNRGAEFEVLAENVMMDRYEKLVDLFVESDVEIALSLCNVCPTNDASGIAEVLLNCFDSRHKGLALLKSVITKEVETTEQESTLFRGTTMATRLVSIFTTHTCVDYVRTTLQPAMESINELPDDQQYSELDPQKLSSNENVNTNKDNVIRATNILLEAILSSPKKAPRVFRELLSVTVEAVKSRFTDAGHNAVSNFVFLRLFGPAIVTPDDDQSWFSKKAVPKNKRVRRLLMQCTRVMQNLANFVLYGTKEAHMTILNTYMTDNSYRVMTFLRDISDVTYDTEQKSGIGNIRVEQRVCVKLHRFLYDNLDRMSRDLASRNNNAGVETQTLLSWKRTLDQLSTLLAQLGRPEDPVSQPVMLTSYKEILRRNIHRDLSEISKSDMFYVRGVSVRGHPVFYVISRNIRGENFDYELLFYYMIRVMEPHLTKPFEMLFDNTRLTGLCGLPDHWFQLFFQLLGDKCNNLVFLHVYNPSFYLQGYVRRLPLEMTNQLIKRTILSNSVAELQKHIPPHEIGLPKSTLSIEEEQCTTYSNVLKLNSLNDSVAVTLRIGPEHFRMKTDRKHVMMWSLRSHLQDIFHMSEIEDIIDLPSSKENSSSRELMLRFVDGTTSVLSSYHRDEISSRIRYFKQRYFTSRPGDNNERGIYRSIRPSDVPGRLLNMTLLNIGSHDPALRLAAYNLLYSLSLSFRFKIGNQLLSARDLCIPTNSTDFIVGISESLASTESHLTLEFLNECLAGFNKSTEPLRQLCLDYMSPWLYNLVMFCSPSCLDDKGLVKVRDLIRLLIEMTVQQVDLYKHFQAKVWQTIAKVEGLMDVVLDVLIQYSVSHGIASNEAEIVADTLVTMSGVVVRGKVISRLRQVLAHSSMRPCKSLAEHPDWTEIAILLRFVLMLSFNINALIKPYLPEIFHIITMMVHTGPTLMRTTVHELTVNVIHALSTGMPIGDENVKRLHFLLNDLCNDKNRVFFGLTRPHANSFTISHETLSDYSDNVKLPSLENIVRVLLDALASGAPTTDVANMWRARWMGLVTSTTFQFNPAIQPRSFVVLGCLAQDEVDDDLIYQILVALRGALAIFHESDSSLIVSILMCLSNVIDNQPLDSRYLHSLFWLAITLVQMGHEVIFPMAVQFLQAVLRALDAHHVFAEQSLAEVLMKTREPFADVMQEIEQSAGVSFDMHFSFATAGALLGGARFCDPKDLIFQCLTTFLEIECKRSKEHNVSQPDMLGYLAGLLAFSAQDNNTLGDLLRLAGIHDIDLDQTDIGAAYVRIFDALVIPNNTTALLLVSMMVNMLHGAETDAERLFLYSFLSEAAISMPEVFSLVYESLLPKMNQVVTTSQNHAIINAVKSILVTACSEPEFSQYVSRQTQVSYLEKLGFSALVDPEFGASKSKVATHAGLASRLLDRITEG